MTMFLNTGRSDDHPCSLCGAVVRHTEGAYMHGGRERTTWMPARHDAPCGRPCLGAGVPLAVYRSGQVHGKGKCPACMPAVAGGERDR